MKGLTGHANTVSIPKKPTRQSRFFHIWRKRLIPKAIDLNTVLLLRYELCHIKKAIQRLTK